MGRSEWLKFFAGAFLILVLTVVILIVLVNLSQVNRDKEGSLENVTTTDIGEDMDSFAGASGVHWTHMPLTYSINSSCGDFESIRVKGAFDRISIASSQTVTFQEVVEDADIKVICSYIEECYNSYTEEVCPHETSSVNVTQGNQNLLIRATIELIGLKGFLESGRNTVSGFSLGECGTLNKEVHAALRAFGYKSNNNQSSIMYGLEEFFPGSKYFNKSDCQTKEIDASIKADLSSTYRIN